MMTQTIRHNKDTTPAKAGAQLGKKE